MLFYAGDILAVYGVLLFVGVWALRWKNRTVLVVALGFFALTAFPGGDSSAISAEQPEKNVTLLKWTAILGIGGTIAGALPVALVLAGITAKPTADTLNELGVLHDASGVLGGFGYAALIVLIALRIGREPGSITRAVSAVGQRSLTCYLIQSVMWTLVFTPYLTDLSDELTVTTTAVLALATWLFTVFLAAWMDRSSYRGPFELLIRWFTPRRCRRPSAASATGTTATPGCAMPA